MEEKLCQYFTDRMMKYRSYVKEELLKMFGSQYSNIIDEALNISIMYRFTKNDLDFYKSIYDNLSDDDKQLIDYFEETLGEEEEIIIGSSDGNVIDYMEENIEDDFSFSKKRNFITVNIISGAVFLNSNDTNYIDYLIYYISSNILYNNKFVSIISHEECLNCFDGEFIVKCMFQMSMANYIVSRLHGKGIYIFDNKNLIDRYENTRNMTIKSFIEEKRYNFDIYLLSKLVSVLPLCYIDYKRFLEFVGKENFEGFEDAVRNKDKEAVYEYVERMNKHLEQRQSVVIDTDSIMSAFNKIKGGEDTSLNGPRK